MEIKIEKREAVFSHQMGIATVIPRTFWCASIFPTRILFFRRKTFLDMEKKEFFLDLKGPWKNFTIQQDLEKDRIVVFGESSSYFRYSVFEKNGSICIHFEKTPKEGIYLPALGRIVLASEEVCLEIPEDPIGDASHEILSLGMHKALDVELMNRRKDLREILPLWFHLGSVVPPCVGTTGTSSLFTDLESSYKEKRKDKVEKTFFLLWNVAFSGMLVPSLEDNLFQGILEKGSVAPDDSPFAILYKGKEWIRSLFFQSHKNRISLLPLRLSPLWCGKMGNLSSEMGLLHMEWTKKRLRRVIFCAHKDGEIVWDFPSDVESYRVRMNRKDRGRVYLPGDKLTVQKSKTYFLDHFQK
ncbi:MAG: hypothetical protein WCP39_05695 [Chlamydiota bacterium]